MKKIFIIIGIIIVALTAFFAFCPNHIADTSGRPVIKIGVILPLSGNMSDIGIAEKGAVQVAVADANKNPDNKYRYIAIFEDSMLNLPKTASITNKLISVDHADALISWGADVVNVVGGIAKPNKIVHFGISADARGADGEYNFINWTMPEHSAIKMAELIRDKGFNNVALISFNQSGALAATESLSDKLNAMKIKNEIHKFNGDIRDFHIDIKKMQSKGADLYVLRMFEPQIGIFIKQLREAGVSAPITGIESFGWINDKSIIEGAWFVDVADQDNDITRRIKEHNKSDVNYGLGLHYDDVMLLVKAFESASDKTGVAAWIVKIKEYDGSVGRLTQDMHGIFHSAPSVKQIKNGKAVVVK
jgi:branched-chain amino acid transport system substrate-binding protein